MNVHLEMTRQVGEDARTAIFGTSLASVAIYLLLDNIVPKPVLLTWLCIQIILLAARFHFGHAFNRFDAEGKEWEAAVRNFNGAMFFIGLGWGAASVLAAYYGTLLDQVVVLAIILGVVGAAISTVAQVLKAYTLFLLAALVPQAISFLIFPDEKHLLLGLLTIVYGIVVYRAGEVLAVSIQKLVEVREHLSSAKLVADEANAAKSQFLSRMSHELRTPLNAILGFSQLQEHYFDNSTSSKLRQSQEHILHAGKHLLSLVEDIFDIVKHEQNRVEIALNDVVLLDIIRNSFSLVQNQAEAAGIELKCEVTSERVTSNDQRLTQVIVNLLSNAIKYNHRGGSVTVSVCAGPQDMIEIRVEDTGVGIDPEDAEKLFAPFSRLTYATQSEIDGTGIGLALSKFLVERMHGQIGFHPGMHRGSCFWVRLPQAVATVDEAEPKDRQVHQPGVTARSVLYIEDNVASVELLKMMLAEVPNVKYSSASSAEEGIEIAGRLCPDFIFIDINLPGMDGISALKVLRENIQLSGAKMIALSADAMPEQIEASMNAGFDFYMTKPIDFEQMTEVLEN